MQFYVMSRQMIEALEPPEVPHVIISIRTPGEARDDDAKLPASWHLRGILRLAFHDIPDLPKDVADQIFAEEPHLRLDLFYLPMAHAIFDFVEKHRRGLQAILIHCDAGLSRSPAVAAGLKETMFERDSDWAAERARGNDRVYRVLLEAYAARQALQEPSR